MARWYVRQRDDAPAATGGLAMLAVGLLAGLAAGTYVAYRLGGVAGISARVRRRLGPAPEASPSPSGGLADKFAEADETTEDDDGLGDNDEYEATYAEAAYAEDVYAEELEEELDDDLDDDLEEDLEEDLDEDVEVAMVEADEPADDDEAMADQDEDVFASADPSLEDRVLVAFTNDPVLSARAIDIGAISMGTIELTGTVFTDDEYEHATVLARGVPGVETVVNRLTIRDDEATTRANARRYAAGDPQLSEAQWESETIGIGRPRQGTSQDVGRHAHPKVPLEDRALSPSEALRNAADDTDDIAERRAKRGPAAGDLGTGAPADGP